jgi:membrane protease YdiL (CAAX protease family)
MSDTQAETPQLRRGGLAIVAIALGAIVLGQILAVITGAIASAIAVASPSASGQWPAWFTVATEMGIWAGFSLAVVVAHRRGIFPRGAGAWRWSDLAYVWLGVLGQIVVGILYLPFHLRDLNGPVVKVLGSASVVHTLVISLVTIIGAPLFEELLFRWAIFGGLLRALPATRTGRIAAVVLSSAIFAGTHFELRQFAGLFLVGCLLAVVRLRSHRVWPSVMVHAGFNGIALIAYVASKVHH